MTWPSGRNTEVLVYTGTIEAVEFGAAVARLVRPGGESEGFRMRAKAVAEACRRAGGRRTAVDKLIEIMEKKE